MTIFYLLLFLHLVIGLVCALLVKTASA